MKNRITTNFDEEAGLNRARQIRDLADKLASEIDLDDDDEVGALAACAQCHFIIALATRIGHKRTVELCKNLFGSLAGLTAAATEAWDEEEGINSPN